MTAPSLSFKDGLQALDEGLADADVVRLYGTTAPLRALIVSRIAEKRRWVAVLPTETAAQELTRSLQFFAPELDVLHLPELETSPWADVSPDRRAIVRRMTTLFQLSQNQGRVLVASTAALARRVIPRAKFSSLCDLVQVEQEIDRDKTAALLEGAGYLRTPVVEDPGTYAVRGGVLDVFVPLYKYPVRIELLGDLVERLRTFDPASQRTLRDIPEILIHPVRETVLTEGHRVRERLLEAADVASHPSSKTRAILDLIEKGEDFLGMEALLPAFHESLASVREFLPSDVGWIVDDAAVCREALDDLLEQADEAYQGRIEEKRIAFPPSDFFVEASAVLPQTGKRIECEPLEIAESDGDGSIRFAVEGHGLLAAELKRARAEKHEELLRPLVRTMKDRLESGFRVSIAVPTQTHAERLQGLLRGYGLEPHLNLSTENAPKLFELAPRSPIQIVLGSLGQGFELPRDFVALYTEEEIFGEKSVRRTKPARGGFKQDALKDLQPGAYVVHTVHGVGIYQGLTKLPLKSVSKNREVSVDFMHLTYEGGAIYLPVWRINEVQAYSGAEGIQPKLDKLGGITWERTRSRVTKEVRQLAEELIQLYAQRKSQPGTAHVLAPSSELMFHEFEATFPFEETPDQERAINDVLEDLEKPRPMDRLVCGDVGYGKTEVAVRAALKTALAGGQVAVLAPTTVLVEQHAMTFRSRYEGLPVKVESLSRFRSKAEQNQVLKALAEGAIDVVVGTHRLLSPDVRFKNLGLVIVDEEQRFGVSHKEKLKQLRTQVDTLTMSATPIPRTLHMAMMGLRDLSVITTPPADRLAVRTLVCRYSDAMIIEGCKRELGRGGQIFFVHNRVEDIGEWAQKLRDLLPGVRVLVGHGQMTAEELEKVMVDFVAGQAEILVCTTIIENGLDIPRANTMFVNQADRFGLAQLYQLRGRIGRSRERAYCYLVVPTQDGLSSDAKARLEVLQRFTELGAGFQIASHDLEIRGAGDLLGAKQSGAIASVGFDTYTAILEEAVASLRGEPLKREHDPELTCDLPGFIPDDYCSDVGQRLEFYRRLSLAENEQEIGALVEELTDRYGPPPEEVAILADIMIVKSLGRRLRATAIELSESRFALALSNETPLGPDQVMKLVQMKSSPWRLSPDMRLVRNYQPAEKTDRLSVAKKLLHELLGQAVRA